MRAANGGSTITTGLRVIGSTSLYNDGAAAKRDRTRENKIKTRERTNERDWTRTNHVPTGVFGRCARLYVRVYIKRDIYAYKIVIVYQSEEGGGDQ